MATPTIDDLVALAAAGKFADLQKAVSDSTDFNSRSKRGWTCLIGACRGGHLEIVKWLLARGADPNLTNPKGTTPLMYAKTACFASGETALLDTLIAAGANIAATDEHGKSALDYIRERSNLLIHYFETNA